VADLGGRHVLGTFSAGGAWSPTGRSGRVGTDWLRANATGFLPLLVSLRFRTFLGRSWGGLGVVE
jgi:hypothetical protein